MRIECDLSEEEYDWWIDRYSEIKSNGYKVKKVYKDNGKLCIDLMPIILPESEDEEMR